MTKAPCGRRTRLIMNEQPHPKPLIRASEIKQIAELNIFHPLNPNSEIHGICLSEQVGFLIRKFLPPSFRTDSL